MTSVGPEPAASALSSDEPLRARARFRAGLRTPTAGWAPGYAQANLIAVPAEFAAEFQLFAQRNPKPCPLLDVTAPGVTATALAAGADLRTDLPGYRIWERGVCVREVCDASPYWRDDLVAFLIGCSFTFDSALLAAGVPVRHVLDGVNVAMYRTNRQCLPAGRFAGALVVSMRPIPRPLVARAVEITGRYPAVHGGPVHIGDPAALGIADLSHPDFGDPVLVGPDDVPVFWACGVTPQVVVTASRLPYAISHLPGHMFITDVLDGAYRT